MIKSKIIIKIGLLILVVIIILAASNVLLNVNSFKSINKEYNKVNTNYAVMSDNLKMMKVFKNREREIMNEINELNILMNLDQEEVITILDTCMKTCNINASKITFSEVHHLIINNENTQIEISEGESAETKIQQMANMAVSLEFTSTYDEMILFIYEIQNYKTEISIANMRIINQDEGENVHCAISLNFYALPF